MSDKKLQNQVALITGGALGLGLGYALHFSKLVSCPGNNFMKVRGHCSDAKARSRIVPRSLSYL